jgi:hypothetical protein
VEAEEAQVDDEPPTDARAYHQGYVRRRSNVFMEAVVLEQGWKPPRVVKT